MQLGGDAKSDKSVSSFRTNTKLTQFRVALHKEGSQ